MPCKESRAEKNLVEGFSEIFIFPGVLLDSIAPQYSSIGFPTEGINGYRTQRLKYIPLRTSKKSGREEKSSERGCWGWKCVVRRFISMPMNAKGAQQASAQGLLFARELSVFDLEARKWGSKEQRGTSWS